MTSNRSGGGGGGGGRRRRSRRRQRQLNRRAQKAEFWPHVVDPQYRDHVMKEQQGMANYRDDFDENVHPIPYGMAPGNRFSDLYEYDDTTQQYKRKKGRPNKPELRPIQGPANWDQLYPTDDDQDYSQTNPTSSASGLAPEDRSQEKASNSQSRRPIERQLSDRALNANFCPHVVDPQYRDHIVKVHQGLADYSNDFDKNVIQAPFGTAAGNTFSDLYEWDDTIQQYKRKKGRIKIPKWRPIQGPANWDQLWPTYDDIGQDYLRPDPTPNASNVPRPLHRDQLNYLKKSGEAYDKLKFIKMLGEGGFGSVWEVKARHWDDSKKQYKNVRLAVKILRLDSSTGNRLTYDMHYLLLDMYQLRYLKHPYIVKFYDIIGIPDQVTGFPYARCLILMELCKGDVHTMLEEQPDERIDEHHTRHLMYCMASAVQYMHRQRVVHFDIKPLNIFLHPLSSTYKLGDFGLAVSYADNVPMETDSNSGTPFYQAPELMDYMPDPVESPPCDVFSLGMTFMQCLFGYEHIVEGMTELTPDIYVYQISLLNTPDCLLSNPPTLSAEAINLLLAMTELNPSDRFTIDQVVNDVWLQ
ncbi:membrane-associated tyrosine- and threonine-specific cdc2-inhibitory kinase-like [Oppia nitens]|uniref:membrane-associated tyrosine- and threonine-specific cdc2-inhibitory kinase-like n=1 Tax=Oppia nitens TaxID=1686743 RepID=UPI0023DB7B58|nr:membrane-associated tyrosine- and threonine-specific cdc2-inhibitory kinase-like [Oppia nitens]